MYYFKTSVAKNCAYKYYKELPHMTATDLQSVLHPFLSLVSIIYIGHCFSRTLFNGQGLSFSGVIISAPPPGFRRQPEWIVKED